MTPAHRRRRRLDVFVVGADDADMGEGEGDDLPGIRGIRQDLLIPGHRGVEADLADGGGRRAERVAVEIAFRPPEPARRPCACVQTLSPALVRGGRAKAVGHVASESSGCGRTIGMGSTVRVNASVPYSSADMGLRERFTEDMKAAMKAKNARRLSTIRLMLAALKKQDIADARDRRHLATTRS